MIVYSCILYTLFLYMFSNKITEDKSREIKHRGDVVGFVLATIIDILLVYALCLNVQNILIDNSNFEEVFLSGIFLFMLSAYFVIDYIIDLPKGKRIKTIKSDMNSEDKYIRAKYYRMIFHIFIGLLGIATSVSEIVIQYFVIKGI